MPTDLPEVYFVTALPAPLVDRIGRSRVLALRGLEGVIELADGSIVLRVTREPEGALNQEGMATRADARAQLESNVDAGAELKRLERRARFVAPVVARWDSPTSDLVRRIAGECFDEGHRLSLLRRLRDHTPAPIREADTEQQPASNPQREIQTYRDLASFVGPTNPEALQPLAFCAFAESRAGARTEQPLGAGRRHLEVTQLGARPELRSRLLQPHRGRLLGVRPRSKPRWRMGAERTLRCVAASHRGPSILPIPARAAVPAWRPLPSATLLAVPLLS